MEDRWTFEYDRDLGRSTIRMTQGVDGDTWAKYSPWYVVPHLLLILKVALEMGLSFEIVAEPYNDDYGAGVVRVEHKGQDVLVRNITTRHEGAFGDWDMYTEQASLRDLENFMGEDKFVDKIYSRQQRLIPGPFIR